MSDARSLLRQQRAARRITHPHAAYSDTGKLLCTLCREPVKTETLWDAHIQTDGHKKRSAAQQDGQQQKQSSNELAVPTSHKRKHEDDEDVDMTQDDDGFDSSNIARRKRSRGDITAIEEREAPTSNGAGKERRTSTPPSNNRRSSNTPSQGVEIQIPSRPATPRDSNPNSSSTTGTNTTTLPSRQASTGSPLVPGPPITAPASAATDAQQPPKNPDTDDPTKQKDQQPAGQVDEDEWAAFEADIAAVSAPQETTYDEATISAKPMTAEESARAKEEHEGDGGDPRRRFSKPEVDLENEREDAARALEDELDEMRDLEAKVNRFKQQRDALRQRATSHSGQDKAAAAAGAVAAESKALMSGAAGLGKENNATGAVAVVEEEEESDEDDEEDDWDGFRFRSGLARS